MDFEIISIKETTKEHWHQMRNLIETENWCSDDHSVMDIIPEFSTTGAVFAIQKEQKEDVLGFVVWNETEVKNRPFVWIGFYFVKEQFRGNKIGQKLWKQMLESIPKNSVLALRAVLQMSAKYQLNGFATIGPKIYKTTVNRETLKTAIETLKNEQQNLENKSSTAAITEENMAMVFSYDYSVTKHDRRGCLKRFFSHKEVKAVYAMENKGISGYGALVPTGLVCKNQFKLAPTFAENWRIAVDLLGALVEQVQDNKATFIFYTLEQSAGSKQLHQLLMEDCNGQEGPSLDTLLSESYYDNMLDMEKCYVPHNHSSHIDG